METFAEALKRIEGESTTEPFKLSDFKRERLVSDDGRQLSCVCGSVFHNKNDRNCPERAR